jgi:hypothetical protein
VRGRDDPTDSRRLAHLWMRRNDLRGYVVLGDPAARLAVPRREAPVAVPVPEDRHPAIDLRTWPPPAPPGRAPATANPDSSLVPSDIPLAHRRERAVLALLRGDEAPQVIAARHGVDLDELFDWLERYREAGRHGLG